MNENQWIFLLITEQLAWYTPSTLSGSSHVWAGAHYEPSRAFICLHETNALHRSSEGFCPAPNTMCDAYHLDAPKQRHLENFIINLGLRTAQVQYILPENTCFKEVRDFVHWTFEQAARLARVRRSLFINLSYFVWCIYLNWFQRFSYCLYVWWCNVLTSLISLYRWHLLSVFYGLWQSRSFQIVKQLEDAVQSKDERVKDMAPGNHSPKFTEA